MDRLLWHFSIFLNDQCKKTIKEQYFWFVAKIHTFRLMTRISEMHRSLLESPNSFGCSYTDGSQASPSSDSSDWIQFQKRKSSSNDTLEEMSDDCNDQSDDELPTAEQLQESVLEKEKLSEEMTNELNDMRERFLWDLALATKRNMITNYDLSEEQVQKLSCKSIQSIVSRLDIDNPQPHEWISWLEIQFRQVL